jgi:hypothetical protein
MTTAEIMTFALSAAIFFEGNFAKTRRFFLDHKYFKKLLSHSKLNRKVHDIDVDLWETVLQILSFATDDQESQEYILKHIEKWIYDFDKVLPHNERKFSNMRHISELAFIVWQNLYLCQKSAFQYA